MRRNTLITLLFFVLVTIMWCQVGPTSVGFVPTPGKILVWGIIGLILGIAGLILILRFREWLFYGPWWSIRQRTILRIVLFLVGVTCGLLLLGQCS